MSKKCDFCGHFNTDEANVCKTCGTSLNQKEEKVRDVLFIDKYAVPLSIIFIFIIPALMFILIGSYDFYQAKYLIISCLFIFLGFSNIFDVFLSLLTVIVALSYLGAETVTSDVPALTPVILQPSTLTLLLFALVLIEPTLGQMV